MLSQTDYLLKVETLSSCAKNWTCKAVSGTASCYTKSQVASLILTQTYTTQAPMKML